ncbi:MAG: methylhydantoinase [Nitrososphaeraceae archaeon]|nr:methylhydantoinase [Nitrososphaeraceae archaeon]
MNRKIRIGIDVGGTFTKAIAIDTQSSRLLGKITTPTTHDAEQGVAIGVVNAFSQLLNKLDIKESEIELISHSTTQAVNALLEGDTAKVGIIGMGVGLEKSNIVKRTNIKDIELAPKKFLKTCFRFIDTSNYLDVQLVSNTIDSLIDEGAEILVVSEAYGVDDPSNESFVMQNSKIPSTAGHELTGLYGLEIRTLTAAINAGIMKKAIDTAVFVESAVQRSGITVPIMIMKGDGGVTNISTFKQKPILTVLSGPAASVAGALLYLKVLHGIFIEVGGTSTNVCIIKNGKPEIKYVTIMDHPTCIRSVDVRVAGIGGGSLIRVSGSKVIDVGPRSAHIAGLQYSCYADPAELKDGRIIKFKPGPDDPDDYVCIETSNKKRYAITNTCVANALGKIAPEEYSFGNRSSAKIALSLLSKSIGQDMEHVCTNILEIGTKKIIGIINNMIKDYKLNKEQLTFIGGGGGAAVLVPYLAYIMNADYQIPKNAEVISSIGVAAAMIYEEKERTLNDPNHEDITDLVSEVKKRAIEKGAFPETLLVQTEYVSERSLLRVCVSGNVSLDANDSQTEPITIEQALSAAYSLLNSKEIKQINTNKNYFIFTHEIQKKRFFSKTLQTSILILDKSGKVRLFLENAKILSGHADNLTKELEDVLLKYRENNDLAPQIHIIDETNIIDFSGLTSHEHVINAVKNQLDYTKKTQINAVIKM